MEMKEYSEEEKRKLITDYMDDEAIKNADEETLSLLRLFIREGVSAGWKEALEAMAYSCYGGNRLFELDWEMSRDCLLKLVEMDEDPFYCNTLGYIYYYGRCNGGVPQYDEALKYFTVGAFSGIFESRYKLADMLQGGLGVPKNQAAATSIIMRLYEENIEIFENEEFDCKFADIALRMGRIYEEGLSGAKDNELAYAFYMQAAYAIKKRRERFEEYGDDRVEQKISEGFMRTRDKLEEDYFTDEIRLNHPGPIGDMMEDAAGLDVHLWFEKGHYYLKATRIVTAHDPQKYLLTLPSVDFCELVDSIEMEVVGVLDVSTDEDDFSAFIHEIKFNEAKEQWEFIYHNAPMLVLKCEEFVFHRVKLSKS